MHIFIKKSQLLPEYSVSKEWKAFLSKEEVVLFDAKNKLWFLIILINYLKFKNLFLDFLFMNKNIM